MCSFVDDLKGTEQAGTIKRCVEILSAIEFNTKRAYYINLRKFQLQKIIQVLKLIS